MKTTCQSCSYEIIIHRLLDTFIQSDPGSCVHTFYVSFSEGIKPMTFGIVSTMFYQLSHTAKTRQLNWTEIENMKKAVFESVPDNKGDWVRHGQQGQWHPFLIALLFCFSQDRGLLWGKVYRDIRGEGLLSMIGVRNKIKKWVTIFHRG